MSAYEQYPEQIDPIAERVGLDIFTDRDHEMNDLMQWADMVARKVGRSQGLVSHRRYGKTAIMERFYNRLFRERDDVMPFYFELHDGIHKIWMKELAILYLHAFLQQFLAYRTKDALLAFEQKMSFGRLYTIAEKHNEPVVMEWIDWWQNDTDMIDRVKINRVLQDLPHRFATETGLNIIVMFDEFQRLNQVLYYDEACTHHNEHYTDTFSTAAESSRAPMLVAGSQVTELTQVALTGAMLGRVGIKYIEPLPMSGAAELVVKYAKLFNIEMELELAYIISRLVGGHPYYIWCLFHSQYRQRNLTTEEGVKKTLTFEVENKAGHIYRFWMHHFLQHMDALNLPHARKMIVYLTQYADDEVHVEQLVEDLGLPMTVVEANDTLQRLIWCDLVREESDQFYGGLSDPMLAWMLKIKYGWEIERLKRKESIAQMEAALAEQTIIAQQEMLEKLQGELKYWVGHVAEVFIKKFMAHHFKDQLIEGADHFSRPGKIKLSRIFRLFDTTVKPEGAPKSYQIDIYALPTSPDASPWVVEVKNWQNPVSKPVVVHFWEAAQHLADDKGHDEVICWFHARGGFTEPARTFMQEKGMLFTDDAGLTKMLRHFQVIERWREQEEQRT
ncbi:MAG: restriction endonuclease [Chloroflexota bacterium]